MATPTERLRAWLDAGREIEERATKGPWLLKHPKMKFFENYIIANYDYCDEEPFVLAEPNRHMENWEQDVQFITDARTRVRVQREVIEELMGAVMGKDRLDINSVENTLALMAEGEGSDLEVYRTMARSALGKLREALDRAARLVDGKKL